MAAKKSGPKKQVVVFARALNSNWARILYGTLEASDVARGTASLRGVRQCLFFSKETGGETGLAAIGPQAGSRVSPKTDGTMEIGGVGLIAECSTSAIAAWESAK